MMRRFWIYAEKVFGLSQQIMTLRDSRRSPKIPTHAIWVSGLVMLLCRLGSLNRLETQMCRRGRLRGFVGPNPPSVDRVGQVYGQIGTEGIRQMLVSANRKMKRNKALPNPWALRWAALDGHEFFTSRSRCCDQCSVRKVKVNGVKVDEYYHRGVVLVLLTGEFVVPLDVEMQGPKEGECRAALRLLKRTRETYWRYFDGVVCDALYSQAPFVNFLLRNGLHFVIVLKGKKRQLHQDAKGLFGAMKPKAWQETNRKVESWDEEGFTTLAGAARPVRVVRTLERVNRRRRKGKKWLTEEGNQQWYWITDLPKKKLSTRAVWELGHHRWDIENRLFNTLERYWSLNHSFRHDPVAMVNFILTLFLAFVLIQSFYRGNLKPVYWDGLSLIDVADELLRGLGERGLRVKWPQSRAG
jgi:hypothetical protein